MDTLRFFCAEMSMSRVCRSQGLQGAGCVEQTDNRILQVDSQNLSGANGLSQIKKEK